MNDDGGGGGCASTPRDYVWFCSAVARMHDAATQRTHLLGDLTELCKALASDVKKIGSCETNAGEENSGTPKECLLSALEALRRRTLQTELPPQDDLNRQSNNNNVEKFLQMSGEVASLQADVNSSENGSSLHELIRRRDTLRNEVASLKSDNERAALHQEYLHRSVHLSERAVCVAIKEHDVFVALERLLNELLMKSEDWLACLQTLEDHPPTATPENNNTNIINDENTNVAQREDDGEYELRANIQQLEETRRDVVSARQASELISQSMQVEVATLCRNYHDMQLKREKTCEEKKEEQITLQCMETAAAKAEEQYLTLRLQYTQRCMKLARLRSSGGSGHADDFLRDLPRDAADGKERMERVMERMRVIVVKYETDLPKLRHIERLQKRALKVGAYSSGEHMFREKYQEIKTAILPCLHRCKERGAFHSSVHRVVPWPLTFARLRNGFPPHSLDTVHNALLVLVVVWEDFTPVERQRLCTSIKDITVNAHLLLMIARYVESRRSRR